jgi:hypothetical protein
VIQNEKEKPKYNLYAIDLFFVEVCCNSEKNKITEIKSFKSGYLLDKYSSLTFS